MRQVLFRIPLHTSWTPDGIPIYGYGLMLFLAFVACTWLASRRARKEGINPEYIHDLALYILAGGILGARIVFYMQYPEQFSSFLDFFAIWNGGLVFYGGMFGGLFGYGIAYYRVIKKHKLSGWKIADIAAPCLALGLCLGRIGCLLNGCCYGDVACPNCYGISFPLSGMPRAKLVPQGWQTPTGFLLADTDDSDPRTVVGVVEDDSAAARVGGLLPGDRIVGFDGEPNKIIVRVIGQENVANLAESLRKKGREVEEKSINAEQKSVRITYPDLKSYTEDYAEVHSTMQLEPRDREVFDTFQDRMFREPKRGENELKLTVERVDRDGEERKELPAFTPMGIKLYPTQLYETISAGLLTLLLLAYTPFRRHDGEVFALFWILYPIHRFLNEMLRNDTDPVAFGLTLSQNGSIIVFGIGVAMLVLLRRMPAQYATPKPMAA
jgi:phosphatidylglycerol:prolipoprotein diacylglycerol transferase